MFTVTEITEKVKMTLAQALRVKPEEVKASKRFIEDFGADSLQRMELVIKLEEAFEIQIPDEEAIQLISVQDVINYIQKRLNY